MLNKVQNKGTGEVLKSEGLFKDECSFKPEVSQYSSQLAQNKRPLNATIKFYETMTEKARQTNEWRSVQKSRQDEELMKECTFTPEVHFNKTRGGHSIIHSHSDRSLFNKSTDRCSKHHLSSCEIKKSEESKNSGSLRRSNKSSIILKHAKYNKYNNAVEDSVRRMREANHEKEIIKIMTERGV